MTHYKEWPANSANCREPKGKTKRQFDNTNELPYCQLAAAQRQQILDLLNCSSLTHFGALTLGIMHPGTRICELRKQGYSIKTEYCSGGVPHRIARYILQQESDEA